MTDIRLANILIVDDTKANLVALAAVLEPLGQRVVAAASGEEALRHMLQEDFACVLLDVQMPGLDGFETAALMKKRLRTRATPIIFLTAIHREEEHIVRGYAEGAVDYVVKPYNPDILRSKVGVFVDLYQSSQLLQRERAAVLERGVEASRREDAARAAEDLYSVLMALPASIAVLRGPTHIHDFMNPTYMRLTGGQRLHGRPIREAYPELVDTGLFEKLDQVFATGEHYEVSEIAMRWRDADEGPLREGFFNIAYHPLRGPRGDVMGVVAFAFDVSAQVRSRQQVEQLAAEVARSEEHFRALAENLPELAWTAQPDGTITFYNRRWYEYTGTTLKQMHGWGWESVHDPDLLPSVKERWKRSLATGEPFEMEFPLRAVDGVYRWFLTRVTPLRDASGRIVRWFGTNTDVDERRRQTQALEAAIRARDTFLSVAAHELKTPLTSLRLQLELVARAALTSPADIVAGKLESAKRQVNRLSALVERLLDVSRIGSSHFDIKLEPVDLVRLVRDALDRLKGTFDAAGSEVTFKPAADAVVGHWDEFRLEQVVTNLLTNAAKYGAGNPVVVTVSVDGDHAMLVVQDRGIGIEADQLARIFGKFERAVSDRHYGGLGLGLFIAQQVVTALRGTIRVESEVGAGATFTVLLPREAPAAAP